MMKNRCYNSKYRAYRRYGGRGIAVCDKWRDDFAAFLADVGLRPSPKHSLDRHPNNDGHYEPGNVRWATKKEQSRNTSCNRLITLDGESRCVAAWAEIYGVSPDLIYDRLRLGWPHAEAVRVPPNGRAVPG